MTSKLNEDIDEKSVILDIKDVKNAINLEFQHIFYKAKSTKKEKTQTHILKNLSGSFYSGKLTAILGPSGAGKTSLLNVLTGFKTTGVTGNILLNGEPRDKQAFRQNASYIPQDFALLTRLTTLETLDIAADLKLNAKMSKITKRKIVNKILELLKLDKCKDTFVSKLSGGERKRLSIGIELITNPPIMFFDEPTSGLDSLSSIQVISHLKELAIAGRCIICVIHQPSSRLLEFFDDLYVISEGKCIYSGPTDSIVKVFKEYAFECPNFYNRADFALEVASKGRQGNYEQLVEQYENSKVTNGEKYEPMSMGTTVFNSRSKQGGYPISPWHQFLVLTRRNILCLVRDFLFVQLRIISHLIIGALLGVVFYDIGNDAAKIHSNASCLFFFTLFIFFANAMPTVLSFPLEAAVFLREHQNNYYSLGVYYLSKLVSDFPLQVLGPTLFLLLAYYLSGQPADGERLLMVWAMCFLLATVAQATGLIAGAIFSMQLGVFIVPCTSIPMLIFSGFFIKLNELMGFLQPITYVSYFRYSFEGMLHAVYGFNRAPLECSETFCYYRSGKKFMEHMNMRQNQYWLDLTVLFAWIIVLQISLYITLKIKLRKSK